MLIFRVCSSLGLSLTRGVFRVWWGSSTRYSRHSRHVHTLVFVEHERESAPEGEREREGVREREREIDRRVSGQTQGAQEGKEKD